MYELDDLERRMLEQARQSLQPAPADESRLWAALSLELGTVGVLAPRSLAQDGGPLAASEATKAVGGVAVKWSTLAGAAALIGAAGFGSGYFVGKSSDHDEAVATRATRAALPPARVSATATSPTKEETAPAVVPREAERSARPSEERVAVKLGSIATERTAPTVVEDAFYEELSLLQRAERAIRSDNPLLALALLGDLDKQFPRGKLLEERAAARVMAGCQQSFDPTSQDAARRFLTSRPQSVYAARVISLCELDPSAEQGTTENGSAKDSNRSGH
jgi:hypothetical protein